MINLKETSGFTVLENLIAITIISIIAIMGTLLFARLFGRAKPLNNKKIEMAKDFFCRGNGEDLIFYQYGKSQTIKIKEESSSPLKTVFIISEKDTLALEYYAPTNHALK